MTSSKQVRKIVNPSTKEKWNFSHHKMTNQLLLWIKPLSVFSGLGSEHACFTNETLLFAIVIGCFFFSGIIIYRVLVKEKFIKKQLILKEIELKFRNERILNMLDDKSALLKEKEFLLTKVHHRVKNNLQVVMSLYNAQLIYSQKKAEKNALIESQARLHTILIIHKKLYGGDNINRIDMHAFIDELIFFISANYHLKGFKIIIIPDVEEVRLDVTQAVAIGLSIHEVIAYAVDFEFSDVEKAEIQIKLTVLNENYLKLVISYGSVSPRRRSPKQEERLITGIRRMIGLCGVLGSELRIEEKNEVQVNVLFKRLIEDFSILELNVNA